VKQSIPSINEEDPMIEVERIVKIDLKIGFGMKRKRKKSRPRVE